jgi:hypothetical protein
MSSIRNRSFAVGCSNRRRFARGALSLLALAGLAPGLTGCSTYSEPIVDRAANDPAGEDEVMARRNWPQQQALFANSTLLAYKNRAPYDYERAEDQSRYEAVAAAPFLFVGQALALPFTLIKYPPGTKQTYSTVVYEPTYTAVPDRVDQVPNLVRIPPSDAVTDRPRPATDAPAPAQGGAGIAPATPEPAPVPRPEPGPPATPEPRPALPGPATRPNLTPL